MTHAPETGADSIFPAPISGVCVVPKITNLGPD